MPHSWLLLTPARPQDLSTERILKEIRRVTHVDHFRIAVEVFDGPGCPLAHRMAAGVKRVVVDIGCGETLGALAAAVEVSTGCAVDGVVSDPFVCVLCCGTDERFVPLVSGIEPECVVSVGVLVVCLCVVSSESDGSCVYPLLSPPHWQARVSGPIRLYRLVAAAPHSSDFGKGDMSAPDHERYAAAVAATKPARPPSVSGPQHTSSCACLFATVRTCELWACAVGLCVYCVHVRSLCCRV